MADKVAEWLKGTVVVWHNAQLDIQFLDSEFHRLKRQIQIPNLIDTLLLARQNYELPSYSLHAIAEAFNVPVTGAHRALEDAHTARGIFFAMMEGLKQYNKPLDEYIGIYNSPVWPNEGIQLPTELGEAIYGQKKLFIRYVHGENQQTERWITPKQVMGLSDYIYLQAHCHMRNAERSFRLDRIIEVRVVRDIAREQGVNVEHIAWADRAEPIGRYLYELGRTPRSGAAWYQRKYSAASRLGAGMVDWGAALRNARIYNRNHFRIERPQRV